jgi:hypothetical protein
LTTVVNLAGGDDDGEYEMAMERNLTTVTNSRYLRHEFHEFHELHVPVFVFTMLRGNFLFRWE